MKRTFCLLLLCTFTFLPSLFPQGSLTPPAAPAPTMKTLDQIEPRTPIPGGTAVFNINTPGSYILTGNLNVSASNANAIAVNISDVTIDLNGFNVTSTNGTGIFLSGGVSNVYIHNGTIKGCSGYAINGAGNDKVRVEQLRVLNNTTRGIYLDVNALVRDCVADGNGSWGIFTANNSVIENCQSNNTTGTGIGIDSGNNCTIRHCTANTNTFGIRTGSGSVMTNCSAMNNITVGITVADGCTLANIACNNNYLSTTKGCTLTNCSVVNIATASGSGIHVTDSCTLTNCSVQNNLVNDGISTGTDCTLLNCTASFNTGATSTSEGIVVGNGSTLTNCTASGNTTSVSATHFTGQGITLGGSSQVINCNASFNHGDGIALGSACVARGNTCNNNGVGDGAGIRVGGVKNQIEANLVQSNTRGIDVAGLGNFITRNTASNNGVSSNYTIVSGNVVGVIVAAPTSGAISGNTGGTGMGTTDPWANFSF